MSWLLLVLAGLVEIAWSQTIKPTQNFTRPLPTLACFVLGACAVYLLSQAMQHLPVGTAYAVLTGIGTIGAIVLGIVVQKDPIQVTRFVALALIIAGVILARVADPAA
ncbi:multidrug efflux SMR transporter [Dactylosporangium sp. NPDC051484]|uniref:DMT family transporter n=1 Tax=Dactylosporangium sp. NPDC051484 TaxID=3154942 RepID=UPI00344D4BE1